MRELNFTKLPNKILEEMAKSSIFCERTRIFCAILRKTKGWNKESDWISLSQFELMTEMAKPNVCRTLNKLVAEKVIIKLDNTYRINGNTSRWQRLSTRIHSRGVPIKPDKGFYQGGKSSLSKSIPTKEPLTKNTSLQKKMGKTQKDFESPFVKERMNENDFHRFWKRYPRKKDMRRTKAYFMKMPRYYINDIVNAVMAHAQSDMWKTAQGKFIPYPLTWLRDERWKDDPDDFSLLT